MEGVTRNERVANERCWQNGVYYRECCCATCPHGDECPGSDAVEYGGIGISNIGGNYAIGRETSFLKL